MKAIKILDWFCITESHGGYYGESMYVCVRQNGKTFWILCADAEDSFVDVAMQAVIENLMSAYPPSRKADANIRKLMGLAEECFMDGGNEWQVYLEDVFSDKTALKVYEQLKNDGAKVNEEDGSHYIVLTPSFLVKWYES